MSEYKIRLGVDLDTSDLKNQISKVDNKYNIKLGIDLDTDNIKKQIDGFNKISGNTKAKLGVKIDTDDVKKQIKNLDLGNVGGNKGVSIPINTESLEKSLTEVKNVIVDIKKSLGSLDDSAGMNSLVASVDKIAKALDKATDESNGLLKSLNELSKKDFGVNIGLSMGSSNPIARQTAYGNKVRNETLPQLKKQVEALIGRYNEEYGKSADEFTALQKLVAGTKLGNGDFFTNFLYGKDSVASRMGSGSLSSQMQAYKQFIDMFKQAASLRGLDISSVTSQFSKTADDLIKDAQDIQTGANEVSDGFEKLKGIFGGSKINGEAFSGQLDSIAEDLKKIGDFIGRLDDNNSIDDLTLSFNNLAETLNRLMTSADKIKRIFDSGLVDIPKTTVDVKSDVEDVAQIEEIQEEMQQEAQQAQQTANVVVQAEEKKQQAYKETAVEASKTENVFESMRKELSNMNFGDSNIDTIVRDIEKLGLTIDKITLSTNDDGLDISIKGTNELGQAVTVLTKFNNEAEELSVARQTITNSFDKIANAAEKVRNKFKGANLDSNIVGTSGFDKEIVNVEAKFDKLSNKSIELQIAIDDLKIKFKELKSVMSNGSSEEIIAANERYEESFKRINNQLDINIQKERQAAANAKLKDDRNAFMNGIDAYLKKHSAAVEEYGGKLLELKARAESCNRVELDHLKNEFKQLDKAIEASGKKAQTFTDRLKTQFTRYSAYLSVYEIFMYISQALKDMFEQVVAIDTAMTELKKVTNETEGAYNKFLTDAASKAKELGTTIDGLVQSTADFARLGYGFKDAQGLAEIANIYAVVGDDIDSVETATQSLISTLTAFKDEANGLSNSDFALSIVDKMNEVSNNFAISSGGIGEALQRSASSMMAANNSLDETIALITAANTVVQDPASVGTAFKTMSMRIRGAKTELEEAGLETDGMVESTAKLREEIMALSGVDIMLNENEFKSTYQIMEELASKWEYLSDIQQATVTELIAGKRQGNIVSSLMENFDIADKALKTSLESSGSAMAEHEKWQKSLEARLLKLKAAWQSLSQSFLNSDFLKFGIDVLTVIVNLLDKIIDSLGSFGTIGFGVGIYGFIKNFEVLKTLGSNVFTALTTNAMESAESFAKWSKASDGVVASGGKLKASMSAVAGGIGLAIAALGLLYAAYKNNKEEAAKLRQETIESSDAFLDSAESFEKAYIKYSGKTSLTSEEEAELEVAIRGAVDALDDKSSALQNVVDSSGDYLQNLEQIARAELRFAHTKSQEKLAAAKEGLEEAALGDFAFLDESKGNVDFGKNVNEEAQKLAKEIGEKYYRETPSGKTGYKYGFNLSPTADMNEVMDYYYMLEKYQKELIDTELTDTTEYKKVTEAINDMSEAVNTYVDSVYDAAKNEYQLANGIPKTAEEYLKMRNAILGKDGVKNASFETKVTLASTLDSEYGQLFDLSSTEIQAKKFVGLIKGYGNGTKDGTNEIGTVETFLNMRTAVNNNECSIGDYMSQFDDIDKMTENWSEEEKKEFSTYFGLDTDTIKQQYDDITNHYMRTLDKTAGNISGAREQFESFLDGMSKYELSATYSLKDEIDWKDSKDNILKQIEEEAKLIEAMSFSINLDIEAGKIEGLSTAIAESVAGAGLGNESMSAIADMFGSLDGYDQSKIFERTANGIRLNSDELRKLNEEYKNKNIKGLDNKMDALGEKYFQTREELSDLTYGTEEYNKKARDLKDIEAQINATETLMTQYKGLTSAYQTWQLAESSGSQRDMYESMIEGFENIDDEISRGWLDDGTIEFLRLIKGNTLSATATTKELEAAYKSLDDAIENTTYSIRDFFTVDEDGNSTNTGVYNFLDAVGQLEEEKFNGKDIVKRDDNGNIIAFDFQIAGGDKAIAEALGISEELVQIMVRAADDAGFVVSMDGTYQQLDVLKEKAQEAANKLKDTFKLTEVEFDLNTGDEGSVLEQYNEALKVWEKFKNNKNKDGTVNMSVEGADEAYTLVSTLQSMVDRLGEPVYMKLDATQVEKDMQTPLSKLKEYETLVQTENQLKLKGTDTSEIDKTQEEIVDYFDSLKPEIKAQLGIENLSRDEIEKKIEAGEIEIPATIDLQVEMNNTMRDMVNVALYNAGIIDKNEFEKRVSVELYANEESASETVNDINSILDESDLSEEKKVTISAFAEVFGVDNIEELDEKLDSLDDEQIQVLAEVLGKTKVEELKTIVDGLDDKTVQAIAEALGKGDVDSLKSTINGLDDKTVEAIAKAFGYSDVDELNTAIDNLDPKTVEAIAKALGITDVDSLKGAIDRLDDKNVTAAATVSGEDDVNSLQSAIDGLKGKTVTIWAQAKKIASNLWDKITGGGGVDGTANVDGTTGRAFKQGSWGTKNSGTALVGELGRETLVRNGRYYTIGNDGAEFIKYQKGDIIFNHKQTEELFANGRVTSGGGRAKALVGGTAFVEGTAFNNGSEGSGGVGQVSGTSVGSSSSKSSSSTKDDFEETIDWIEVAIDRIEREIDKLDQKANNIYKSWTSRNSSLKDQINEVGNEIALQNSAYNRYIQEANSVGLSESWAEKVRNGKVDIQTITDEDLKEKIDDYKNWYEKALDCKDAIEELKETESKLYAQRVENVATQYEGILGVIEHEKNMIDEYISQSEANAQLVSGEYYKTLISNENEIIGTLKEQKAKMLSELQAGMESGTIVKGSEGWYELVNSIDEVTLSIAESETAVKEYVQSLQQLSWESFELLQSQISAVTEEADFLIELMSSDKLYNDKGQLTESGMATMGLHGQNYNTYMYQADQAGAEAERLKAELEKDPFDTELLERYNEMVSLRQENILAAQGEKEAIRDMVEEGINVELDALQEVIDKKNEALDVEKDLYDYQKRVKEQTVEIANLEKQIASYGGDISEETNAKVQQLKLELSNAKEDLKETEYERMISDTQQMLDALYEQYEEILNTRLDNLDALVSDMITEVNANASTISTTITTEASNVGYTLSDSMKGIWDTNSTKINDVITTYGQNFTSAQTTTNNTLSTINTNLQSMIGQLNSIAKTNVKSASTSSAANSSQANVSSKPASNNTVNQTPSQSTPTIKVGGKINAGSAKIYSYVGSNDGLKQYYKNDPIYTVLEERSGYLKVRYHKLSSGVTGWFKKGDVKAYATGARRIDSNQWAWTQEGNKQELIVRPSDGAILTPVARNDSVLNANASSNIWNMANSPAEFIKDNLNLGEANVPNNSNVNNNVTQNFGNITFSMPNVHSYNELITQMQKDKNFEKLILSMSVDRLAGKSSLAKNKSIR